MASHYQGTRPDPDKVLTDIADYVLDYRIDSALAFETARNCLIDTLGCGLEALDYPACTKLLGPLVPGMSIANGAARAGHVLSARSGAGRVQHRHHDPLARFQRHLACRGMGPSFRQSRRHPRRRRLAVAQRQAAPHARRADRDDQGARDPGRDRAGELLQQGRPRSRGAGEGRLHRRGLAAFWVCRASASSTRCRKPSSTARRCAPIATRRTPDRARAGRRATRQAAPCAWRSSARPARWAILRCSPRPIGASTMCCSRASRSTSSATTAPM